VEIARAFSCTRLIARAGQTVILALQGMSSFFYFRDFRKHEKALKDEEFSGNASWSLIKDDLNLFIGSGLQQVQFENYLDQEEPPTRRFRVEYQRRNSL
jgi:hypothetical protein